MRVGDLGLVDGEILRFAQNDKLGGLAFGLDDDGGAVAEDFGGGGLGADFCGVVSDSDDGVGAHVCGVFDEEIEGLLAGLFAHFGVGADASADEGFESAEDALGDGGGADDDSPDDTFVFDDAVAFDGEGGGDGYVRVHGVLTSL